MERYPKSTEQVLDLHRQFAHANCLILDVAMRGMSRPELQQELKQRGQSIPIVFITAHRVETILARVLGEGATECLFKPTSDTALNDAVNAALW